MTFFMSNSVLDSMKEHISHGIELVSKTFFLKELHCKELFFFFVCLIVCLALLDLFSPLLASPLLFFSPDTNHVSCSDSSYSSIYPGPRINVIKAVLATKTHFSGKVEEGKGSDYINLG